MTDNNFQIYSAAVSDRGLSEKRPQNEDSFLEMRNLGLFAVADGVGGAQAGDVASQMAVEILGEAFANLRSNGDAEEMMKLAIERANSAIYQMSSDLPQLSTMATTVVALHISGNIATIGHVGDSRIYRLDAKGSLFRETQDHSVVEEEVRAGRMTAAQAANHPSRNVISRALGAESTVEVDMKTIMFDSNSSFLLCSDGITRHIQDFEIRELLMTNNEPSAICAKMKEICYSRGAEDNLTAVIVRAVHKISDLAPPEKFVSAPPIDEEATIAAVRPAAAETSSVNILDDDGEISTRALEMPASMQTAPTETSAAAPTKENIKYSNDDDEAYLMEKSAPETAPVPPVTIQALNSPATTAFSASEFSAVDNRVKVEPRKDFTNYETPERSDGGFLGKLLSALVLLAVGAILGVGGYYFWQMSAAEKPVTPVLNPQTNNIPKATTDTLRFDADTDPSKVIKQYETAPPKDASDFYILGRAYLKLKNYEEAKRQFILARNNLRDVRDAETKAVLDTDITQGLTIAQDKTVQAVFEREAKLSPLGEPSSQANSNQ